MKENIKIIIIIFGLLLNQFAFGQALTSDTLKCSFETIKELRINKDNISEELIQNFLLSLGESCKNNAEFSQSSNGTMFWLADIETEIFLETLKKNQNELEMDWIISQFRQPINDGIDLESIYQKIQSLNFNDNFVQQILDSIKAAAKGLGIKLD